MLAAIVWLGTRDMYSAGLTKGAVSRETLFEVLESRCQLKHEPKAWAPKAVMPGDPDADNDSYLLLKLQ